MAQLDSADRQPEGTGKRIELMRLDRRQGFQTIKEGDGMKRGKTRYLRRFAAELWWRRSLQLTRGGGRQGRRQRWSVRFGYRRPDDSPLDYMLIEAG